MNPVPTLDFSTPKSLENKFSGIFTYLKLVLKYYKFTIFQHILCKTNDESLQKEAELNFVLLLTYIYSIFLALPIVVTQLKRQKTK